MKFPDRVRQASCLGLLTLVHLADGVLHQHVLSKTSGLDRVERSNSSQCGKGLSLSARKSGFAAPSGYHGDVLATAISEFKGSVCQTAKDLRLQDAASGQRQMLIIGSSVAAGFGASDGKGWSDLLASAASPLGVQTTNLAISGTQVDFWQKAVEEVPAEDLAQFHIAVVGLSLANELAKDHFPFNLSMYAPDSIRKVQRDFTSGLRTLANMLKDKMGPGIHLVLAAPYPNDFYSPTDLGSCKHVLSELRSWGDINYVIDFLQPVVADSHGHWHRGSGRGDGFHPNDRGYAEMFECIDVEEVLGLA